MSLATFGNGQGGVSLGVSVTGLRLTTFRKQAQQINALRATKDLKQLLKET